MVSRPIDVAEVWLWDQQIGAVAWDPVSGLGTFEYHPRFLASQIELAPLVMPLGAGQFRFPAISRDTYYGLPALPADSLPDRFGNQLIDAWLRETGKDRGSFSPVEKLCYVGTRGMGALEYRPAFQRRERSARVDIVELAGLAAGVLASREEIEVGLDDSGLSQLLRVGTSAGGARAKALVAWNPATDEVRSGQVKAPAGFEYWILKFDGVGSAAKDLTDPEGYGRIEYAYHLMAVAAGIDMTECRLHVDASNRAHFMTRRFDRGDNASKLHMQSLSAVNHYDYNQAGRYSYEDAMATTRALRIPAAAIGQLYRRMVFNVVGRNQDDHTKNIAYLMDKRGKWSLSPAYDVTWAYNPQGDWTGQHQMTINGKRDGFTRADLVAVADRFGLGGADDIVGEITETVSRWADYAEKAGVAEEYATRIEETLRLDL